MHIPISAPILYENYYNPKAEMPKVGGTASPSDVGGGPSEHHQGRPLPRLPDEASFDAGDYI